jgi:hypothetical protein
VACGYRRASAKQPPYRCKDKAKHDIREEVSMRLVRAIAAVGIVIVPFAMACQGSPDAPDQASGGDNSSSPAPTAAVIEKSGFGGSGDYLWVTATVRDVPLGSSRRCHSTCMALTGRC